MELEDEGRTEVTKTASEDGDKALIPIGDVGRAGACSAGAGRVDMSRYSETEGEMRHARRAMLTGPQNGLRVLCLFRNQMWTTNRLDDCAPHVKTKNYAQSIIKGGVCEANMAEEGGNERIIAASNFGPPSLHFSIEQ